MTKIGLLSALLIFAFGWLLLVFPAQAQSQAKEKPVLHLILDNGFLFKEKVTITIRYTGRDSTIYSGELYRPMWTQDHNVFTMPLEAGKWNGLTVECVSRGVTFQQGFLYNKRDVFIDLGINFRNEFSSYTSDEAGVFN